MKDFLVAFEDEILFNYTNVTIKMSLIITVKDGSFL